KSATGITCYASRTVQFHKCSKLRAKQPKFFLCLSSSTDKDLLPFHYYGVQGNVNRDPFHNFESKMRLCRLFTFSSIKDDHNPTDAGVNQNFKGHLHLHLH